MSEPTPQASASSAQPAVLFLPFHAPSLRTHLVLARAMLADGRLRPLVLALEPDLARQAGEELGPELVVPFYAGVHYAQPSQGLAYRALTRVLPPAWGETLALRRQFARQLQGARAVMQQLRPKAVIGAEDRKLGPVASFWRLARDAGALRLLVPFAMTSGHEDVSFARLKFPEYFLERPGQRLLKAWAARRHPGQVYRSAHGPMLFFSPSQTLALASLDLLPRNPWHWGGGGESLVALSGQEEYEDLTGQGLEPARAIVTGEPNHDDLYNRWQDAPQGRQRLAVNYGLDPGRLNLVWAVPQLAEHKVMSWDEHWKEIGFLASALAAAPVNLLMSLHPKSDPAKYRFLEERHGAHLLEEPLNQALPLADLFVAAYSSTVRWAVMLGIPTLVADFYGVDFKFFDHLRGVVKVTERERLPGVLMRLCRDQEYRQELIQASRRDAGRLAPLDGQANRRIIDLIADRI